MIVYFDTSALVKVYIREQHTDDVVLLFNQATAAATHLITYVETRSAFARANRNQIISEEMWADARDDFEATWRDMLVVALSPALARRAAEMTEGFGLRSLDGIHLASAEHIAKQSAAPTTFASFDRPLNRAARLLGLQIAFD